MQEPFSKTRVSERGLRFAKCPDMKIVITAVDGSQASLKGVSYAANLAKALGAKLELAYISFPNLVPRHVNARAYAEIEEAESLHAQQVLDAAEKTVSTVGVECIKTRRIGSPAEELSNLAARPEVWCVVIGAKGHSTVSRMLLGSVADRLVHICPTSVLVVR